MRTRSSIVIIFGLFFSFYPFPAIAKEDCIKAAKLSDEASDLMPTNAAAATNKLREAIESCDKSASLYFNFAISLYKQGMQKEAEAPLENAISLNPDYAKALNALAYLIITRQGDMGRARTLAQKAVELEPRNREYRDTLEMLVGNVDDPPKTSMNRPDAIAVIIGNKNYETSIIPPVKYAAQDAATMKRYLVDALGFDEANIVVLKDAKGRDFVKYFGKENNHQGWLYSRTKKGRSDIFIFYSGHGAPDTNTKKGYLVPSDADLYSISLTGYSLDTLYENLALLSKERNPKSITVVLDACFSGESNDGVIIPNASPIFIETTTPILSMKNAVVFSSSRGNQISSWYPEKNHGLFTYFFLKGLKESLEQGKQLTASDMEKMLLGADSVNDYAWRLYNREQEPQVIGDKKIVLLPKGN